MRLEVWREKEAELKENVDDIRESPTLQLLECQAKHLAEPLKVYDPFISTSVVKKVES